MSRDFYLLAIEVITGFNLPAQGQRVGLLIEVKSEGLVNRAEMIAVLSEQRSRRIQAEQRCEQDKNQCCNALRHNGNHVLHVGLSRAEDASTSGSALTELRGVSSGRADYNMALRQGVFQDVTGESRAEFTQPCFSACRGRLWL